jgi:hypothetical protein
MAKKIVTKDAPSAEEILLARGQEVTILGVEYTMRRLSTQDVFSFSKLLSKALQYTGNQPIESEQAMSLVMMSGLAENDKEVSKFYSSLIGMTGEDFMGQPPEFLAEYLDMLPKQYDLASFFQTVLKTVKSLGSLWQTH